MKRSRLMCMAAVLAVLGGAPAPAAILWQQTFDPHPSGATQVALGNSDSKAKSVYLYVDGGTFNYVNMYRQVDGLDLWWEYDNYYHEWYLGGNDFSDIFHSEMHPSNRMAQLIYNKIPSFNTCHREPRVVGALCAKAELYQEIFVDRAVVAGHDRFTLTLSTERLAVPEPTTWALTIAGFGGLGSMLRRNRRRTAPAV